MLRSKRLPDEKKFDRLVDFSSAYHATLQIPNTVSKYALFFSMSAKSDISTTNGTNISASPW